MTVEYLPPIPEVITTDSIRLRQILVNLIGNAFKFTESGEIKLQIRLSRSSNGETRNQLIIRVSDTGCGIPEEKHADLFEPFSQVHSVYVKEHPGTGLGLCISKRLARLLGGDLRLIESKPSKGSVFELTIDLGDYTKSRLLTTFKNHVSSSDFTTSADDLSTTAVLIVEDSEELQALMKTILETKGATVFCAGDGPTALKIVDEEKLDLIIMDIQLPKMSGYEIVDFIRKGGHVAVPIVAITAHATVEEKDRALRSGFNHFLSKPITSASLIEVVSHWSKNNSIVNQDHNGISPLYSAFDNDINIQPHITNYVRALNGKIALLKQLIQDNDWSRVRNTCHQMKGTSNSFGFPEVSTIVKEIESITMSSTIDSNELETHITQLNSLHNRMQEAYH